MSSEAAALSRHDLQAKIVRRCRKNEAFRKKFASDPAKRRGWRVVTGRQRPVRATSAAVPRRRRVHP